MVESIQRRYEFKAARKAITSSASKFKITDKFCLVKLTLERFVNGSFASGFKALKIAFNCFSDENSKRTFALALVFIFLFIGTLKRDNYAYLK